MKLKHTDSLPTAERRRVEALRAAIAINAHANKDGYPEVSSYLADAEEIERWLIEANGEPMADMPSWARQAEERGE